MYCPWSRLFRKAESHIVMLGFPSINIYREREWYLYSFMFDPPYWSLLKCFSRKFSYGHSYGCISTGKVGIWMYRLDDQNARFSQSSTIQCIQWYVEEAQRRLEIRDLNRWLSPCPCTGFMAWLDWSFIGIGGNCYTQLFNSFGASGTRVGFMSSCRWFVDGQSVGLSFGQSYHHLVK